MEIQAKDCIDVLSDQRNKAHDQVVELTAALLSLQRENAKQASEILALKAKEPTAENMVLTDAAEESNSEHRE